MSTASPIRRATTLVALAFALGACVYRMDIQQGNVLDPGDIDLVAVGMTRSQVQFLLGTPMINDPFHRDRWDYPYYYVRGRNESLSQAWISVYFDGDTVTRIEKELALEVAPPPSG